jgi:hypothetical protein
MARMLSRQLRVHDIVLARHQAARFDGGRLEAEKAIESAHKFLLAPMYLIYDLATALLPGVLFSVLILVKHIELPSHLFASATFGYKTKIAVALFISYIIGRCFRTPIEIIIPWLILKRFQGLMKHPRRLEKISSLLVSLVMGAISAPKLFEKISALDIIVLSFTNTIFSGTTALVLITAGFIPGDGRYRTFELAVGIAMLLVIALRSRSQTDGLVFAFGGLFDVATLLGPIAQLQAALAKIQSERDEAAATADTTPTAPR